MNLQTLSLILLAALFHSIWNIIAKTTRDKLTLLWLQMIASCICIFPILLIMCEFPPREAWPTLCFSGLMQAAYYLLLSKCYQSGNLAIVYPLTRGSAPVFVCLLSALLGLEQLTIPVFFSLMLIVFGIYIVNLPALSLHSLTAPFRTLKEDSSTRLSVLIGISIAFYTLSDKVSVRYTQPLVIYFTIALIPAILLAPRLMRRQTILQEINHGGWLRVLAVSLFTFLAYYLVLVAMKNCSASYVSSIREVSVVFVALYASLISHDRQWKNKAIGSVIIFIGIFLISYFSS